jgi:hypothetical protein
MGAANLLTGTSTVVAGEPVKWVQSTLEILQRRTLDAQQMLAGRA